MSDLRQRAAELRAEGKGPTGGEHHWQLLVDLAEAGLQRDIEDAD